MEAAGSYSPETRKFPTSQFLNPLNGKNRQSGAILEG